MEFEITKANIRAKFFLYRIYLFATTIILAIFSTFLNFVSDDIILEKISESGRVEEMSKTIYVILLVLVIFFLIYFNHFFLKNRSKDIGILDILGFSKAKLIKILCYESIIILSLSYIFSIILGSFLYLSIKVIIVNILKLNIYSKIYFDSIIIFKLLIITLVTFIINMIINTVLVMKQSLIEFVNYSKKSEKIRKVKKNISIMAFFFLITGYIICISSFWGIKGIWKLRITPIFMLVIFLIVFGTVILIKFGLIYLLDKIKKNKDKLYTPIGNIVYPKIIFRISSKNRLLIVLSLLITVTVIVIGIMTFTLVYPIKAVDRLNPSVIEYRSENMKFNEYRLKNILKSNNAQLLNVEILRVNIKPSIPITENGSKKINFLDIVKYNDYIKLMKNQGRTNEVENVKKGRYLLINYYPTEKPLHVKYVLSNNDEINISKVTTNNIFSFANSVTTLIVDDEYYENLRIKNVGFKINLTTINGNNLRDSKEFYDNFREIENIQSSYLKKYSIIRDNSSTFIFISFISILFVICTASILYFTSLIEIIETKEDYNYLRKIGYSNVEITNILKKEIGMLYKIPLVIGVLNGSFILFAFRYIFIDNLIKSKYLILNTMIMLSLFTGIYFLFYYITKKAVNKIIKYDMRYSLRW
ncbi:FtsX-like permease family protein [Streptobacillus moniliformis]|uniref:FtsX-like permease family protein n=1 Tax=Streptobacillus moniliformis TaxID=34105 RepID=UPI0007E4A095|nr:FtsX-like permease family protein [Streptobacillus moniliformis]